MVVTHGSPGRAPARRRGRMLFPCVLPFEPPPREFFAPQAAPARLTRLRDKLELIEAAGVERVHVARFDRRFASLPAERFVEEVLVKGLATRWLLVGRDFRFGARRAGDFGALAAEGGRHDFEVESM